MQVCICIKKNVVIWKESCWSFSLWIILKLMVKKLPSREILGWISNFLQHPLTCLLQYFEENVHYCNNEQDQLPFCCCHNSYLTDEFLSKHMNSVDSLNQTMDTKSEKSVQVVNRAQLKHYQSQLSTLRGNINHFPTVLWEDWKGKEKKVLTRNMSDLQQRKHFC